MKYPRIYIEHRDTGWQVIAEWPGYETIEAGPYESEDAALEAAAIIADTFEEQRELLLRMENAA